MAVFLGLGLFPMNVFAQVPDTSTTSVTDPVKIPNISPKTYAQNIDTIINAAPQVLFWVLILFLAIAIGVVVIKALNPLSDDSEEKFGEGRKWFQRTGTLFIFPIVLIVVVVIVYTLLGFGNPFAYISGDTKPSPVTKICTDLGGC